MAAAIPTIFTGHSLRAHPVRRLRRARQSLRLHQALHRAVAKAHPVRVAAHPNLRLLRLPLRRCPLQAPPPVRAVRVRVPPRSPVQVHRAPAYPFRAVRPQVHHRSLRLRVRHLRPVHRPRQARLRRVRLHPPGRYQAPVQAPHRPALHRRAQAHLPLALLRPAPARLLSPLARARRPLPRSERGSGRCPAHPALRVAPVPGRGRALRRARAPGLRRAGLLPPPRKAPRRRQAVPHLRAARRRPGRAVPLRTSPHLRAAHRAVAHLRLLQAGPFRVHRAPALRLRQVAHLLTATPFRARPLLPPAPAGRGPVLRHRARPGRPGRAHRPLARRQAQAPLRRARFQALAALLRARRLQAPARLRRVARHRQAQPPGLRPPRPAPLHPRRLHRANLLRRVRVLGPVVDLF